MVEITVIGISHVAKFQQRIERHISLEISEFCTDNGITNLRCHCCKVRFTHKAVLHRQNITRSAVCFRIITVHYINSSYHYVVARYRWHINIILEFNARSSVQIPSDKLQTSVAVKTCVRGIKHGGPSEKLTICHIFWEFVDNQITMRHLRKAGRDTKSAACIPHQTLSRLRKDQFG